MIIVPIKEGESIDKALKKLKKKFDKIGVKKEIRARQEFTKKSVITFSVLLHKLILDTQHEDIRHTFAKSSFCRQEPRLYQSQLGLFNPY